MSIMQTLLEVLAKRPLELAIQFIQMVFCIVEVRIYKMFQTLVMTTNLSSVLNIKLWAFNDIFCK